MTLLPTDIILTIVDSLVADSGSVILPASHIITQTLLSFTRVCRATSRHASALLIRHCLYLDSAERVYGLVHKSRKSSTFRYEDYRPTRMYLAPFPPYVETDHELTLGPGTLDSPMLAVVVQPQRRRRRSSAGSNSTSSSSYTLPPSPLNDLCLAIAINDLLTNVGPSLTRLVINMPLRSLYPEDDHDKVRPVIRDGFLALPNLEEFVSIQDELFLRVGDEREVPVWATHWPKLQRLALYNVDLTSEFWHNLSRPPALQTTVFTRVDGLLDEQLYPTAANLSIDVARAWTRALDPDRTSTTTSTTTTSERDQLSITFVDIDSYMPRFAGPPETALARVMACPLEMPDNEELRDDPRGVCQEFIQAHAVRGTLFNDQELNAKSISLRR